MAATVTTRRRSRRRAPAQRRGTPRTAAPTASAVLKALARARRSGGPVDRALYSCACGNAFTASVSTTVGCPSCGVTQAW
jgi:hypothetical protein